IRPFVMPEIADRHPWRGQFAGDFDQLARQIRKHIGKAGGVSTRMGEALNDPYSDRITNTDEYDWYSGGLTFRCRRRARSGRNQDPWTPAHQLSHGLVIFGFVRHPDHIHRYVPTFD